MKNILLSMLVATALISCGGADTNTTTTTGFDAKDINDPKLKDLTGAWMLKNMTLAAMTKNAEVGSAFFENARDKSKNGVMVLNPGGKYFSTIEGQENLRNWEFVAPNLIRLTGGEATTDIAIAAISADTLSGSYELLNPQTNKHVAKVNATWAGLQDGGEIAWTDTSIYGWNTRPQAAENADQIRNRLRSLVKYNYLIANSFAKDTTQAVNTNDFRMPFEYYRGSVALKQENPEDNFARLFFNGNNAHIAFEQLREAFKKAPFPKTGNYVEEYAEFFKRLAAAL